jgi:flagellar biosynthesis protein FlhA
MNPISLGMVSAAAGVLAIIPGMPIIPFAALSIGAGVLAWTARRGGRCPCPSRSSGADGGRGRADQPDAGDRRDQDRARLRPLPLINDLEGRRLTDQIKALRRTLAADFGFVMPASASSDNMRLPSQGLLPAHQGDGGRLGEVRIGS